MKISIDKELFTEFPEARIGYLTANLNVRESDPYVEGVKKMLERKMNDIGISADTMMNHPDVYRWRWIFGAMRVKPSKFKSSLEALLRRLFKGDMWNVSSVVDLYNCISVLNLKPVGAYDAEKLKGNLALRRGRAGEKFCPLGSGGSTVAVDPSNVVYADDEKVCCWLWNYRDARETAVSAGTRRVLFIVDHAFDTEWRSVEQTIADLAGELKQIGAEITGSGAVDAGNPSADI